MSTLEVEVEAGGYDSWPETADHIRQVRKQVAVACSLLHARGMRHDASKLVEPELSGWNQLAPDNARPAYGSLEYIKALGRIAPTVEEHYAVNDHHPEHHKGGVSGMSALAIIEMVCDWKAAYERGAQRMSFGEGLVFNQERFGYGDDLARVIYRTAEELGFL